MPEFFGITAAGISFVGLLVLATAVLFNAGIAENYLAVGSLGRHLLLTFFTFWGAFYALTQCIWQFNRKFALNAAYLSLQFTGNYNCLKFSNVTRYPFLGGFDFFQNYIFLREGLPNALLFFFSTRGHFIRHTSAVFGVSDFLFLKQISPVAVRFAGYYAPPFLGFRRFMREVFNAETSVLRFSKYSNIYGGYKQLRQFFNANLVQPDNTSFLIYDFQQIYSRNTRNEFEYARLGNFIFGRLFRDDARILRKYATISRTSHFLSFGLLDPAQTYVSWVFSVLPKYTGDGVTS